MLWIKSGSSTVVSYVFDKVSLKPGLELSDGRINVLFLGIAGDGHDGPNLTDTIIVASFDNKSHRVDLISIPRDLWLDKYHFKVNALYETGLSQKQPFDFVRDDLGQILGIKIPYVVRVDFSGFEQAVDLVDGIDLEVPNSFEDGEYPLEGQEDSLCGNSETIQDLSSDQAKALNIPPGKAKVLLDQSGKIATASAQLSVGLNYTEQQVLEFFPCRFAKLSFKQGLSHMDGATALKFVRSRHGSNGEGSDFARSKRQQLVLQAFKQRVLSLDTLTDPQKIIGIAKNFNEHISTNISRDLYPEFLNLLRQVKEIRSIVINQAGNKQLLITPPTTDYGGAWVLIPPNNDFTEIKSYVNELLSADRQATGSGTILP